MQEVKDRIKSKADELFYKYGIKSVTMDEIASQLGISKKTIYLSYKDKDELVDDVFSEVICKNEHHCKNLRVNAKDAIHEGFLAIQMMEEIYGNMNPNILFDLERNHLVTFKKFQQHKFKFLFQSLMDNLKQGIEEGLYRNDFNLEVAIKQRLENMLMPFSPELFPKNKFNLNELQRQFVEFFLFSMATTKGYKLIIKYKEQQSKK